MFEHLLSIQLSSGWEEEGGQAAAMTQDDDRSVTERGCIVWAFVGSETVPFRHWEAPSTVVSGRCAAFFCPPRIHLPASGIGVDLLFFCVRPDGDDIGSQRLGGIQMTYLLTSVRVFHEQRSHDGVGLGRLVLLAQLRELEEDVLVQLDAALQDAQKQIERVIGQRRFHHVEQRLVLDEPLLDVVLAQRQLALVRRLDRRRSVGHGPDGRLLVGQVQLFQFGQGDLVRLHHAMELQLERVVQVQHVLVGGADQSVLTQALDGLVQRPALLLQILAHLRVGQDDDAQHLLAAGDERTAVIPAPRLGGHGSRGRR